MSKCILGVLTALALVAPAERTARASCESLTYFAPSAGARVPPNATTYVFPSLSENIVTRVTSGGREVEAITRRLYSGPSPVIAVTPEADEIESYTIEVYYVSGDEFSLLSSVSYRVDATVAEPEASGPVELEGVSRHMQHGFPCAAYDLLHLRVDVAAPAYRVEWSRSERAYRDGDRQLAIVKRWNERVNEIVLGTSGCGQVTIDPRDEETLFLGITPLGFNREYWYEAPSDPTRIDVADVEIQVEEWGARAEQAAPRLSTPAGNPARPRDARGAAEPASPGARGCAPWTTLAVGAVTVLLVLSELFVASRLGALIAGGRA